MKSRVITYSLPERVEIIWVVDLESAGLADAVLGNLRRPFGVVNPETGTSGKSHNPEYRSTSNKIKSEL
jgi:rRNA processing protein Gar1